MKQCQSCGMPLHKDPNGLGGGTEKDGSISTLYCSLCYTNSEFNYKGSDVEEFKNIVENAMKKSGYGWFMRKLTRRQIPYLARWKRIKKLKDGGYIHIYEWHDNAGIVYNHHCHEDRVCVCIVGGDVTFRRDDNSINNISSGNYLEIAAGKHHTVLTGPNGCDYIVGEMVAGDS